MFHVYSCICTAGLCVCVCVRKVFWSGRYNMWDRKLVSDEAEVVSFLPWLHIPFFTFV